MKVVIIILLSILLVNKGKGQTGADSLLAAIDKPTDGGKEKVQTTFKSPRIIMAHSVEMLPAGVLDFRILHRFGSIKTGINEMFGLDNAIMRMSFDYGITNNVTVGIGRSTLLKDLDFFVKARLKQQESGAKAFPLSIAAVAGVTYATFKNTSIPSADRSAIYAQLLLGKKFGDRISLQLSPTFLQRNSLLFSKDEKSVLALGIGGRVKMSNRIHLLVDAVPALTGVDYDFAQVPLSVGVDIETGGHVFQLHFSNATGMNEKAFITSTTQKWGRGDISFGFNLSRVFQLKKNRESKAW